MKITESFVHVAMREYLKKDSWILIAGEFPNGTDDELSVLSIMDPSVARDQSPDPRRHSEGEVVPDLVAKKNENILIIEAKPKYSLDDENKLLDLLNNKKDRLIASLKKFSSDKGKFIFDYDNLRYIPVLAFGNPNFDSSNERNDFGYIYVKSLSESKLIMPRV